MIDRILSANKFLLLSILLVITGGVVSILSISKESSPDVTIPTVRVIVAQTGASPEDVERMLVLPVERELSGISGIERLRAWVFEGRATLSADFAIGTDMNEAIDEVKEATDRAKVDFPGDASEPRVSEDNPALYPIMSIGLYGSEDRNATLQAARDLKQKIERAEGVFEVDMIGDIDDMIEVTLNTKDVLSLGLTPLQVSSQISSNNRLINSGDVTYQGEEISISVPGLISSESEISDLPIAVVGDAIIRVRDIAEVSVTHHERTSSAFIDGSPSITLDVSKNIGTSTVDVAHEVSAALEGFSPPDGITIKVMDDQSIEVMDMLKNLSISVLTTIVIVVAVLALMLSPSSAILVGATIPLSFFMAFSALYLMGYTANSVVLFALILVTGMLVDSAIVVSESADKTMSLGGSQYKSYINASKRMAAPIVASLMTTIVAFFPMLFWPGTTGQFMKYLPLTVIVTLVASLVASLIFMPAISSMLPLKNRRRHPRAPKWYQSALIFCVKRSGLALVVAAISSGAIVWGYAQYHQGVEFFPEGDAENITVRVYQEGSQPLGDMEKHMHSVEDKLTGVEGIERINTTVRESSFSDMIGSINMSLVDWRERPDADEMISRVREAIGDISPLRYEIISRRGGPREGKPIAITLSHERPDVLNAATDALIGYMGQESIPTSDVTTERKTPGKQWEVMIDKSLAAYYGVDLSDAGGMINMATRGTKAVSLILPGYEDEVDVMIRLPEHERTPEGILSMQIPTENGLVPLSVISNIEETSKLTMVRRSDQKRTMRVEANVSDGAMVSSVVESLRNDIGKVLKDYPGVDYEFRGESADSDETQHFLIMAFIAAMGLMLAVLLFQMNSWTQAGIIFLAVAFSVVGVLLTLIILQQPFGVVFSGLAILALAGISINHNIILIDEYNHLRQRGVRNTKAAISSALSRFRPILLTVLTTSLGLIPMIFEVSFDMSSWEITTGDPSMKAWSQLSSNIVGGLIFSASLSLIVTPCLLALSQSDRIGNIEK